MTDTPWYEGPMLAFDLETTGADPEDARIVTAVALHLDGADRAPSVWVRDRTDWLANPGIPIPDEAAAIHGITTEHARENGAPARGVVEEVTLALALALGHGTPVVGYNVVYDLTVLDRECRRHHIPTLADLLAEDAPATDQSAVRPVVDARVLDKQVDRYRKGSRKLTDVAKHYGVQLTDAHTADADALAAAAVTCAIIRAKPGVPALEQLHDQQVLWFAEQAAGLQAHFRRTGNPTAIVESAWPVHPARTP